MENFLQEARANLYLAYILWDMCDILWRDYQEKFKYDLKIDDSEKSGAIIIVNKDIFPTRDDFCIAIQNNILIAYGTLVMTMQDSLESAGWRIDNLSGEKRDLYIFIRQLRNCFAHNMSRPKWEIKNKDYRKEYSFYGFKFDLTKLHGEEFEYKHAPPDAIIRLSEIIEKILQES